MGADRYALAELREETWQCRLARVCNETRDLVAATRKVIDSSHAALAAADENLKMYS